jgi:TonB-dependent siderophore receptor
MLFANRCIVVIGLAAALTTAPTVVYAQTGQTSQATMEFNLAAQPLARALLAVGSQANVIVTFDPAIVRGRRAAALKGQYTVRQAFDRLLAGSGLVLRTTLRGTFLIEPVDGAKLPHAAATPSSSTYNFNLRAQSLAATLQAIHHITDRKITLEAGVRDVLHKNVTAIHGTMTPFQALQQALAGTNLQVAVSPTGALTIGTGSYLRTLKTITVIGHVTGLTATRTSTPLREIPQSVSIIGPQRISDQNLFGLTDVMNQVPGISVEESDQLNSSFYSRGFLINSYHVDGGAAMDLVFPNDTLPDMSEYSRVEVLRGADALFGGAGNPGGTINLVRKQPHEEPELSLNQSIGSWDTYRTVLDATGPMGFGGKLLGRVVGMYEHQNFFYQTATSQKKKLYGIVEYKVSPSTLVTLGGSIMLRHDIPMTIGLPRYLDGGDIHLPRSTFFGMPWEYEHAHTSEAFAQLTHRFGKKWKFKFQATRTHEDSDQLYADLYGPVQRGTGDLASPIDVRGASLSNTSLLGNAQLSGSFDIDGWRQDVLVGTDFSRNDTSYGGPVTFYSQPVSVFNLQYFAIPQLNPPVYSEATSVSTKQTGLYAALRLRAIVHGLSVVIGARDNRYRQGGQFFFQAGSFVQHQVDPVSRFNGKVNPFAGATYDLGKHYSVYASYAGIYAPGEGGDRAADGSLVPGTLTGVNIELGGKGAWYGGLLNGSVALFKINQSGLPLFVSSSAVVPNCCYVNGSNRSHGFELELDGRLTSNWMVGIGYTFNINREAALPGSTNVPLDSETPRQLLKLWTNYRLPVDGRRWSVGGELHAQTSNYVNGLVCSGATSLTGGCLAPETSFNVTQGAYAVFGLRVAYNISPDWSLAVNLNNVFDRVYYQTIGSPTCCSFYGAPRNVMVTLHGRIF